MSTAVKVRPRGAIRTVKPSRVAPARPTGRPGHASRLAPPATQRPGGRRPAGVRGPRLNRSGSSVGRRQVPPVALGDGIRLTDRGLALAMTVAVALVITAILCITTTAVRVTAEPASGSVGVSSVTP